ncbi:M48 family metalloprotease (plasmid) [Nocardiopsis flavescens]|nr:M48 family metalloprotease [Nocardiopsis flavescens]
MGEFTPEFRPPREGSAPTPESNATPGQFQFDDTDAPAPTPAVRGTSTVSSGIDTSAKATALLVLVPKALVTVVILLLLNPVWAIAWLAAGALALTRRGETLLAKVLQIRPPTAKENGVLRTAWANVVSRSGLDPDNYSLWVQDSSALNAFAAGGGIVTVTRAALTQLKPHQLEAVLAHELGHHVRGHARVSFLLYFYGIPADFLMRFVIHLTLAIVMRTGLFGILAVMTAFSMLMLFPPTMLLMLSMPLSRYFSRQAEFSADQVAAQLGYGPALHETLQQWLEQGDDDDASSSFLDRALATHPPLSQRIIALESYRRGEIDR